MAYYLEGVDWTARQTTQTTIRLLELFRSDRERVVASARGGATLRVYEEIQRRVIVSIRRVSETVRASIPTVTSSLRRLEELGIVRETTGRKYGRMFAYQPQLDILNETGDMDSAQTAAQKIERLATHTS
jgi:Fic family protein